MGLDSVDLIVAIESAFDIKLTTAEAESAKTVGKLYDVVWQHIKDRPTNACNSQINFYRFRRGIHKVLGTTITVLPETKLAEIIPRKSRRIVWKQIAVSSGLRLPPLVMPAKIKYPVFILFDIILLFVIFVMPDDVSFLWGLILLLSLNSALAFLLVPFSKSFEVKTVKELIANLHILNANHSSNRAAMKKVIDDVIADRLGIDKKEITPEKSFVADFGIS